MEINSESISEQKEDKKDNKENKEINNVENGLNELLKSEGGDWQKKNRLKIYEGLNFVLNKKREKSYEN